MNKILISFFLLASVGLFSQNIDNIEVDYNYKHNLSKVDTAKITELFSLIINPDKSIYISKDKIIKDSINRAIAEKKDLGLALAKGNFNFHKLYESLTYVQSSKVITVYKHIKGFPVAYAEDSNIVWTLMPQTRKMGNSVLNLATCDLDGRRWFVWYDKNYPLTEGPYKFKNLPGLVFDAYDSEHKFQFQLASIRKRRTPFELNVSKFTVLPKKKYIEAVNSYIYNPFPSFTSLMTPESKEKFIRESLEKNKNVDQLDKSLE